MSADYKRCKQCGQIKKLKEFYKDRVGYKDICKDCKKESSKEYYRLNKEVIKERAKVYYLKSKDRIKKKSNLYYYNNREKIKKYQKIYRINNAELMREYDKNKYQKFKDKALIRKQNYYLKNSDKILEQAKDYYKRNKDTIIERNKLYKQNRKAICKKLKHEFTAKDWRFAKDYFNNCCAVCKKKAKLHMDHWIPLVNKNCPGTVKENIIPLCPKCNLSKNSTTPNIWLFKKFDIEIAIAALIDIERYFSIFNVTNN